MGGFFDSQSRQVLGGPSGSIVGIGSLTSTAGSSINPLPAWMRGAVVGGFAGWFTVNSTPPNLARLFNLRDASEANRIECYIEPGSNRWQILIRTNSVDRAVIYPAVAPPSVGATVGFAVTWSATRLAGVIGASTLQAATYDIPILTMDRFTIGDRAALDRTFPATFRALEWFDQTIPEAELSALATRALPIAV